VNPKVLDNPQFIEKLARFKAAHAALEGQP
jgi:hypothetical protein